MYMNNAIKYLSLAAAAVAVAAVASSCSREEDDIWSQSAAERLEAAKSEYHKILCSAPNGWEMYYFAGGDERGYNFLMKFASDSVVIATRNSNTSNAYAQESSAFEVIADDGPVLTFNTYNTLFHRYADPQPDQDVESDGVGSGGDYEFKLMEVTDTMIYMRGKKTGREIYMYPLDSNTDWEQYFTDIYAMRDSMFNSSIPTLWLELADGVRYSITDAASQVMHLVPEGGDAITQTSTLSYVLTPRGFRWITDFPGDTITTTPAREFVWNEEGTYLVSTAFGGDDCTAGATIKAPVLADLFMEHGPVWRVDADNLGGQFASAYSNLDAGLRDAFRTWYLNYINFTYYATADSYTMLVRNATSNCRYYCTITPEEGNIVSFNFDGTGDNNGMQVANRVPEVVDFYELLNSTKFELSSSSEISPSRILFTSVNNPADYFYVVLQ